MMVMECMRKCTSVVILKALIKGALFWWLAPLSDDKVSMLTYTYPRKPLEEDFNTLLLAIIRQTVHYN